MADYTPQNPAEQYFYDALWKYANPSGEGELGGKAAVTFFQMSGVDIGILKQIWSLSTPIATMSKDQFFSAIRYITMMQQGEIPLNKERLRSSSKVNLGLPKFNGVDIPPYKAPVAAPAINPALYAITPKDHVKYHELFLTYDLDKDGFLTYDECMNIFRQSGVDPQALTAIYAIADDDKDARLTSKEFSVAFHLIICLSKKNLPLPTVIPQMLKGFLVNAPAVPVVPTGPPAAAGAPAAAPAAGASQAAPPVAPSTNFTPVHAPAGGFDAFDAPPATAAAAPAPAAAPVAEISGFDAFDSMDITPSATLAPLPSHDFGRISPVVAPVAAAAPASVPAPAFTPAASAFNYPSPHPAAVTAAAPVYHHVPPTAAPVAHHTPAAAAAAAPVSNYNKGLTYTEQDEYDISQSVDAIKATTKKSLSSQETLLDNNSRAVSSLQGLKQKLATDKISLEATVNNAHINTQESIQRLEASVAEVAQLTEQLKELRHRLETEKRAQNNVEDRHKVVNSEKAQLVRSIEDVLNQLGVYNGDVITKTSEAGAAQFDINVTKQATQGLVEQESHLKHSVADLSNEIATLKHILANVTSQRDQVHRQVGTAHTKMLQAQGNLKNERDIQAAKQSSVNKLTKQVGALKTEKQHLLTDIEHASEGYNDHDGDHTHEHHANHQATAHSASAAPEDSDNEEAHFGYDDTFEEKHTSFHSPTHGSSAAAATDSYKSFEDTEDAFAAAAVHDDSDPFSAPVLDASGGFEDLPSSSNADSAKDAFDTLSSNNNTDAFETFSNTVVPSQTVDGFDDSFATSPTSAGTFSNGSSMKPAPADDAFGSFGNEETTTVDPFAAPVSSGFDDFSSTPATSNKAAGGGDAFDSFSATTASTGFDDFDTISSSKKATDAFGATSGSDAFDAFGATATTAAAPTSDAFDSFSASTASGADAFDAFSGVPAATSPSKDAFDAFGPSTEVSGGDAFDAFGSAAAGAASAGGDEDPFASFGSDKNDDPFA